MAKATKMPSGSWICQAMKTVDGKHIRKSFTAETKAQAEALAASWKVSEEEVVRKDIVTLQKAMDTYIDACRCSGMSPSTIRGYTIASRNGFPSLLDIDIHVLTTQDIQVCVNEMSSRLAPKTIRNYIGFLTAVLKQYEDIPIRTDKLKLPKAKRHEMEIPSKEQVKQMLDASTHDDDLYNAILLASMMGLRLSEACALTWSSIVTIRGERYLKIESALVPDEMNIYHVKGTKTEAGNRMLPIPSAVYKSLTAHRNISDRIIRCKPCAITTKYAKLTDKLQIPGRFHDLRHYHASVMLALGVPEKYICSDMGHSTFDMVRRVYGHVMEDKQQQINSQMEKAANELL